MCLKAKNAVLYLKNCISFSVFKFFGDVKQIHSYLSKSDNLTNLTTKTRK